MNGVNMKSCIIDNEKTMCREYWQGGVLMASIYARRIMSQANYNKAGLVCGLNRWQEWSPGLRSGDIAAMDKPLSI